MNGQPFRLEPYQIRFLNDRSTYRLVNKARQIGFSTIIGAEGGWRAATSILRGEPYNANYISINQIEASDKIEIVRALYHSIPDTFGTMDPQLKPVLWTDSEFEISFHRPPHTSALYSQPASSAVRGGRKDIYFDEFAHVKNPLKLYRAALPAITRGDSRITIVSTPLGQSGLFYDIAVDQASYPLYSRHTVPWWEAGIMVKDGYYEEALALAAELDTETRVKRYGTPKLLSIYDGFGDDMIGFQTEYEATFVDESEAFFPWDLIVACTDSDQRIWKDWAVGYEPHGQLAIGLDLAKLRDQSVFTVSEIIEDGDETRRKILFSKATQDTYDSQFSYLKRLIKVVRPSRVSIDMTGVGQVFVERAKRELHEDNIEGVMFTNAKKEKWATQFKSDMQLGLISWPPIPDLRRQIHGIRRTKTEANFYKFAGTHDDHFWSAILSLYGEGRSPSRISWL